jgi:hypothetical protein
MYDENIWNLKIIKVIDNDLDHRQSEILKVLFNQSYILESGPVGFLLWKKNEHLKINVMSIDAFGWFRSQEEPKLLSHHHSACHQIQEPRWLTKSPVQVMLIASLLTFQAFHFGYSCSATFKFHTSEKIWVLLKKWRKGKG